MPEPYYADGTVTLYHGDCREVIPSLDMTFDAAIVDPPYAETSLAWDRWPDGWPAIVAAVTHSIWCFGSMRMFLDRRHEFADWKLSQDVVWEKHNGTGFAADRFKRVHEHALHWYRGPWQDVHHVVPRTRTGDGTRGARHNPPPPHTGAIGAYVYVDDGLRLTRSVLKAPSVRSGSHPTEKPTEVLVPLIQYAVPDSGSVLDPMAGSGSTANAARLLGRRCVLIEADERYCEVAARRLDQGVLLDLANGGAPC